MNKYSITYKITFIFLLALIGIILAFFYLMRFDQERYTDELNNKYTIVSKLTLTYLYNHDPDERLEKKLKEYGMKVVKDKSRKRDILNSAERIQKISSPIGSSTILYFKREYYLLIESLKEKIILKDVLFQPYRYRIIELIFTAIVIILLVTYVFTIRRVIPLIRLKREIDKFAHGDLDINCKTDGTDEISQVSNAFHNAVEQIKKLNNSRVLFLRNVMHEFKTPITKGVISTEMLPDSKQKERLERVFQRLESLLNEFIAIEQLTSGFGTQEKRHYRVIDILDEALDLMLLEKNSPKVKIEVVEDISIAVDFKLFAIAMKNMIDNALKYSTDKRVIIKISKDKIEFINKGKKLEHDISYYIEPFVKGTTSSQSFGLGLYIVVSILEAHGMKLGYRFEDGYNIFSFEKEKGSLNESGFDSASV
ncbi:MAG: HAMP domain-containing histidine kinase [Epsilonproteobacteria bacterium]|nr:HAMP domain-containing histidine kinase [Campylobacterota bacterium]